MNMQNSFYHSILSFLRRAYKKFFLNNRVDFPVEIYDENRASKIIYNLLSADKPCMVARFGSNELNAIVNYIFVSKKEHSIWKYICGENSQWWWDKEIFRLMESGAGFFPADEKNVARFSQLMLQDMPLVDVLGSWCHEENYVSDKLINASKVRLLLLEPYWTKDPWTRVLEGKNILVIHPFAEDIIEQYTNNRAKLFKDQRVLPQFNSLRVIKAVQSIGGVRNGFKDWFDALHWMEEEMDHEPYDIALIGCGAYGFPLAAYAKRTGHKAVHLGGALQLLFGIKGKRWDKNYNKDYDYSALPNEYWISPSPMTQNDFTKKVEDGCYW